MSVVTPEAHEAIQEMNARLLREQQAQELLRTIKSGPSFDDSYAVRYGPHNALQQYLDWVDAEVIPALERLIPEMVNTGKARKRKK